MELTGDRSQETKQNKLIEENIFGSKIRKLMHKKHSNI